LRSQEREERTACKAPLQWFITRGEQASVPERMADGEPTRALRT
jgi:hypothetical protein